MSSAEQRAPHQVEAKATVWSPALPRPGILALVVFAVAVVVPAGSLEGPWLFDDLHLILRNPHIQGFEHWTQWFTHDLFWVQEQMPVDHNVVYWRPLVLASYAVDWWLSGGHAAWFHATNLVVHGLASLLGFVTLRRWVGSDLPAFAGALLFAVHPAKMESVAWISGRADLWMTLGLLVALAGLALRLRGRRWGIAVEVTGTLVAYLSKEHAIVLPALAAIEGWVAAGRPPLRDFPLARLAPSVVPHLATAGVYFVGRHLLVSSLSSEPSGPLSWVQAGFALDSLGALLAMAFWPANLSYGQGLTHLDGGLPVFSTWRIAIATLYLVVSVVGVVALRRRSAGATLGILLFLALLAPVTIIGSAGVILASSPRYLYLPLLAPCWLMAIGLDLAPPRGARVLAGLVALLIGAAAPRAVVRSLDFSDPDRYWTYELKSSPDYLFAHTYFVNEALVQRRPRAALEMARTAFDRARTTRSQAHVGSLLTPTMESVLWLTPDSDRKTLVQLRQFAHNLRAGNRASLKVPSLGLDVEIAPGATEGEWQREHPLDTVLVEARVASRLGKDSEAIALGNQALQYEIDRGAAYQQLVLISARAERFDLTERIIDRLSASVHRDSEEASRRLLVRVREASAAWHGAPPDRRGVLAARFYVLLQAWGRAYSYAESELGRADRLPGPEALVVAELAFRAGHVAPARRLLLRLLPPDQVQRRFSAWSLEMGWIDAPVAPSPD